jgi:hypothetical protein
MTTKKPQHWATIARQKFPVTIDDQGVARFHCNRIVRDLVDAARDGRKFDINAIARKYGYGEYTYQELKEFYLTIGYSVSGIAELSFFQGQTMRSCCWEKPRKCANTSSASPLPNSKGNI